jgi:hypothetical protein
VCDLVHLERRGVPAVGIATAPFADEAIEPACRMVYVAHPVQLLTAAELSARAHAVVPAVVGALTEAGDRAETQADPWIERHSAGIDGDG